MCSRSHSPATVRVALSVHLLSDLGVCYLKIVTPVMGNYLLHGNRQQAERNFDLRPRPASRRPQPQTTDQTHKCKETQTTDQRPQTPLSRLLSRPMRPPGNLKNESTPDGGCSARIIFKLTRMDIIMSVHDDPMRTRSAARENVRFGRAALLKMPLRLVLSRTKIVGGAWRGQLTSEDRYRTRDHGPR